MLAAIEVLMTINVIIIINIAIAGIYYDSEVEQDTMNAYFYHVSNIKSNIIISI